jgi:hypothetical protein
MESTHLIRWSPTAPAVAFSDRKAHASVQDVEAGNGGLSIKLVPGRDADMQRKLVALSEKKIDHVNGQTLGERALERLKMAVQLHRRSAWQGNDPPGQHHYCGSSLRLR